MAERRKFGGYVYSSGSTKTGNETRFTVRPVEADDPRAENIMKAYWRMKADSRARTGEHSEFPDVPVAESFPVYTDSFVCEMLVKESDDNAHIRIVGFGAAREAGGKLTIDDVITSPLGAGVVEPAILHSLIDDKPPDLRVGATNAESINPAFGKILPALGFVAVGEVFAGDDSFYEKRESVYQGPKLNELRVKLGNKYPWLLQRKVFGPHEHPLT